MSIHRFVRLSFLALACNGAALLSLSGCGGGPKAYPVEGTVKYKDGTPMTAGGLIIFNPMDTQVKVTAQGEIKEDGTLQAGHLCRDGWRAGGEVSRVDCAAAVGEPESPACRLAADQRQVFECGQIGSGIHRNGDWQESICDCRGEIGRSEIEVYGIVVVAGGEVAEHCGIDRNGKRTHRSVAECELADAGMVAAELPDVGGCRSAGDRE